MSYIVWGIIAPTLRGDRVCYNITLITQDECVAKRHNNRHLGMFHLECFTIYHAPKPILYLKHCRNNDLAILDRGRAGAMGGVYVIRICTATRTGFFNSGTP
jgi:hypothetical protein